MKKAFLYYSFLFLSCITSAQNKTYNFINEGPYFPNLNEEWAIVKPLGDTLEGGWVNDTFFQDDNIHSYIFRDSGVETRLNLCNPPTDLVFRTQFGLPYSATLWAFRSTREGYFLLGFEDFNEEGIAELNVTVKIERVRYNPETQRVVAYQNGRKTIITNPINE